MLADSCLFQLMSVMCTASLRVPVCVLGEFIIGRVIKAMNNSWHPDCFCCDICQQVLADVGFVKNAGSKELTADARELKGELYCLPCHDKMGVPICGACRRPIEGRVVNAMGKQWHVEKIKCSNLIILLLLRNKFVEFDMKPVCKKCYEKFPLELKKRLKKLAETVGRK
ncbi:UNVERIFIED_CONTAM: hypothetical protein FKN15_049385 [Acipenser sinensis]